MKQYQMTAKQRAKARKASKASEKRAKLIRDISAIDEGWDYALASGEDMVELEAIRNDMADTLDRL